MPAVGPEEGRFGPLGNINQPAAQPATGLPGQGLAQHPMLLIGEWYHKIFLVNGGKVIWTYLVPGNGEFDDIWLLSNGHILFSYSGYAAEVTPQKKIVWRFDAPGAGKSIRSNP